MNISVRQVLRNSSTLFKANFLQIVRCSLIATMPPALFMLFHSIKTIIMDANGIGGNVISIIGLVIAIFLWAVIAIGYTFNLIQLYDGKPLDWRNIIPAGFGRVLHMIWFYLCSAFFYLIGVFGISLISGVVGGGVLFLIKDMPIVGRVVLIVLALSILVGMILFFYSISRLSYGFFDAIEHPQHSVRESYARSWNMTKGYIWKTILYNMILIFLITLVVVPFAITLNLFVMVPTPSELLNTSELLKNNFYILALYFIINIFLIFWFGMYDAIKKAYVQK